MFPLHDAQDPLNAFERKWHWLLRGMRVYGTKAKILVNSEAIFRSAEEQATQNCFYDGIASVLARFAALDSVQFVTLCTWAGYEATLNM